jgi:hypothetical protein
LLEWSRLPQAFTPLQSLTRRCPHRVRCTALPRFSAPPAQPFRDEPPLPELPPPGHVAPSPFLPASTPCSRRDLPGVSTGRALGVPPSRARPAEDRDASRRPRPLLRLASPAFAGPLGAEALEGARDRASTDAPSGRHRVAFAPGASLQGVDPSGGWHAAWGSPPRAPRRPSWVFSSLGLSPLPVSGRRLPGPLPFPFRGPCAAARRPSSRAVRKSPRFRVGSLCS